MKPFLFFIAALWIFGCGDGDPSNNEAKLAALGKGKDPLEFGTFKYVDLAKTTLTGMESRDVNAFLDVVSDDGLFIFNTMDTLKGKPAITDYWNRRVEVIKEIAFDQDVWLAIDVNQSTQGVREGHWVLSWYRVNATYESGGSQTQFMHTSFHFNEQDEVDVIIQYMDRLAIKEAQEGTASTVSLLYH